MKVCTIADIDDVDRVLKHPSVYDCISDDFSPKVSDFTMKNALNSNCHVIMPNSETVFIFIPHNGITYDIHITTTPEGRRNLAVEALEMAKEYAFEQIEGCQKLICFIPELYINVSNFAMSNGFKKEGTIKESYQKNGKLYDENIYGLRRSEWQQRQ